MAIRLSSDSDPNESDFDTLIQVRSTQAVSGMKPINIPVKTEKKGVRNKDMSVNEEWVPFRRQSEPYLGLGDPERFE